jgi:hypothetical protein
MSIDAFFHKKYERNSYNCAHFVCEVWQSLTGESITQKLAGLLEAPKDRRASFDLRRQFKRLERPESPCLALMQRRGSAPHVGLFLRGRVLHIHETGVEFQPIDVASRGFEKIGFYK